MEHGGGGGHGDASSVFEQMFGGGGPRRGGGGRRRGEDIQHAIGVPLEDLYSGKVCGCMYVDSAVRALQRA